MANAFIRSFYHKGFFNWLIGIQVLVELEVYQLANVILDVNLSNQTGPVRVIQLVRTNGGIRQLIDLISLEGIGAVQGFFFFC